MGYIFATFKTSSHLSFSSPLSPIDMVVGVLVLFEEPVCLEAPPANNFVDLEGANMAIGILLSEC